MKYLLMLCVAVAICSATAAETPMITKVAHQPPEPRTSQTVLITTKIANPGAMKSVVLEYQLVDPGHYIALADAAFKTSWTALPMHDDGQKGDAKAGDGTYSVELPSTLQVHRRLVRYRIHASDSTGAALFSPANGDVVPNYAYFVYDGVPGWKGAIDPATLGSPQSELVVVGPKAMQRVQAYQLIAKDPEVKAATWYNKDTSKEFHYTGTFIANGRVYDHVGYRARGGEWRYAMGKNMWKFKFNKGESLRAQDDYGRTYPTKWSKLNLRSTIQQGNEGKRGEEGMFESVGFRMFNLAGSAAPLTHWVELRIISGEQEAPADQYSGDFWGLYLAIENEDGNFLKAHGFADGNVYKMMHSQGELEHQGSRSVTNSSDIRGFLAELRRPQPDSWWRDRVEMDRYYSYRSILEAIHHYDVAEGKNYTFYVNPETKRAQVLPWDIDLTWANDMFGSGREPFSLLALTRPVFRVEYQNRLREIRDLLFNPEQTGQLIDECAAIVWDGSSQPGIVEADRMKWDYHPIMTSSYVNLRKAGTGIYFQGSPTHDFPGMVQFMKNWVKQRSEWIDQTLLNDPAIPETPKLVPLGGAARNPGQMAFKTFAFKGTGAFAAMQWRVAEVNHPQGVPIKTRTPGKYEITAAWQSMELTTFKESLNLPAETVQSGHAYRVRVRMKDTGNHWSHWSDPVEFIAAR